MSINRLLSFYDRTKETPVAAGFEIENEGVVLVQVREDGVEAVRPSAGSLTTKTTDYGTVGTEVVVGFSSNTSLRSKTRVEQALVAVPSISNGAIGSVQLNRVLLNAGTLRVVNTATNAALPVDVVTSVPGSVTAGHVSANLTTGTLYFNVAQSGISILATFRRTLSATEVAFYVREAHVNANSSPFLGSVSVIRGYGELHTDWFDTTQDFSAANALFAGVNGLVTPVATDGTLYFAHIPGSRVVKAPTIDDDANLRDGVTLGLAFNIG